MNIGAFLVIDLVGEEGKSFNGLFRSSPALAASMGVFMASLVGIPPFSGFWGKAWIIFSGAQSGSVLVYVVVGALVVNSVLSVPYYFGIIRNMFFEKPTMDAVEPSGGGALKVLRLRARAADGACSSCLSSRSPPSPAARGWSSP